MEEKKIESTFEALTADIAKLHKELAALAAGLKKIAERPQRRDPADDGEAPGVWAGFQNRIEEAGERGGKVVKGFAHEVERHPLIGGIALFGIGFMLATLLFKRSHPHHTH